MTEQKVNPSILPGFMELLPKEQLAFNKILSTIKECFELFGFTPLDTPVIEKAEILTAKAGGETERQMYAFKKGENDLALRFDLTVPLARYVAQYYNELTFPFRRYQIGKVYRGEKPQKGRFREFYQCDVDIIAKDSLDLFNDAEVLAVLNYTFSKLNFGKFLIKINNRKILTGFIQELGLIAVEKEFLRTIDKLEKIGQASVEKELSELGLSENAITQTLALLEIKGDSETVIKNLQDMQVSNAVFQTGISELTDVSKYINDLKVPETNWTIDLTIARGLDYYTGTVYETVLTDYQEIGSICSGGRYDNLAEQFTDKKLPGVGISIGLSRLFDQLRDLKLVAFDASTPSKVLIIPMDETFEQALAYASNLRENNIPCELFSPKNIQFRKKLEYANKINVPYVAIIGSDEVANNTITVKNMLSGDQKTLTEDASVALLKS